MKKVIIGLSLVSLIAIGGCDFVDMVTPATNTPTNTVPFVTTPPILVSGCNVVSIESIPLLKETELGADGIAPADVSISKVVYNAEISTWTRDIPELNIESGDQIAIYLYNHTQSPMTFNLSYAQPDRIVKDEYVIAPTEVEEWFTLASDKIEVSANSVGIVEARLDIPEQYDGLVLPEKWAFQVLVIPEQEGNVQKAYYQNWLITMRD